MNTFEINPYSDDSLVIYFPKKNVEFIIDKDDHKHLQKFPWSCKLNNKVPVIYYTDKDKKIVFFHRFIMNVKQGSRVYYLNKNVLDLRKKNLIIDSFPNKFSEELKENEVEKPTIDKFEITTIGNPPHLVLCNISKGTFEKLEGNLTSRVINQLNDVLRNYH